MATVTSTLQSQSNIKDLLNNEPVPITCAFPSKPQSHDVETSLNFFKDNEDGSPPHATYVGKPETYKRPRDTHKVVIHDVSGEEDKYTLDEQGFQFLKHTSVEKNFVNEEKVKDEYYREVDQLLKDVYEFTKNHSLPIMLITPNRTGATRTFIFDHTIRRPNPSTDASLRGPVHQVHIDQSSSAAISRVPYHLSDLAPTLLQGRFQLINVWRPIKPVLRDPLAVASAPTVRDEDLVPIPLIYEKRKGETLGVRWNEGQEWYYKYRQGPEEVLLIKCFDSEEVKGRRVPHSAFEVEGTEGLEGRKSIEVRCLVFYEDEAELE